jgi:CBS domain containing-hemolysin-like protein
MTALLLYFSLAMTVSFLCSLLEAVILSISHSHIQTLVQENHRVGRVLQRLKDQIDRPLAAILTLNTVAHTVGAAGVGAEVAKLARLRGRPVETWVGVASAILTLCILFFTEIVPKTLGAVHWKRLAPAAAWLIQGLAVVLFPIVTLLEIAARVLTPRGQQVRFTREELMAAAEISKKEGSLGPQESRIIHNLLNLQNIRAKEILTPRSVILAWPRDATVGEIVRDYSPIRFSRILLYGKDLDDIAGLVHRYKVLETFAQDRPRKVLTELAIPVHAVPETKSVAGILDEFIQRREHLFLVVDEYGGTVGLVTLEDAVETLLGAEIMDEFDSVEDMRKFALQTWERRKRTQKM